MNEDGEVPMIAYGPDGATFARTCPKCNRFVKADRTVYFNGLDEYLERPEGNATCGRCGRVEMPFLGFFGSET